VVCVVVCLTIFLSVDVSEASRLVIAFAKRADDCSISHASIRDGERRYRSGTHAYARYVGVRPVKACIKRRMLLFDIDTQFTHRMGSTNKAARAVQSASARVLCASLRDPLRCIDQSSSMVTT
jgi:hypothetical protein